MDQTLGAQAESAIPERFEPPETPGQLVEAAHLARYRWAAQLAAGRSALDAGCGAAYGSALLADAGATSVLGIDIAAGVLDAARAEMPANVTLATGDLRDLRDVPSQSADLIVCFDVLEHVSEPSAVLTELRRVLAAGGVLVVSSPDRDALRGLLLEHFDAVEFYRQQEFVTSAVLDDVSRDVSVAAPSAVDTEGATVALAVAGSGALPKVANVGALGGLVEVRAWTERFAGQEALLREQQQRKGDGDELRGEIDRLRTQLIRAETEAARVPELNSQVAELRAQIEPPEAAAQTPEQRMRRAERTVDQMSKSLSWRITKPLRSLKRWLGG